MEELIPLPGNRDTLVPRNTPVRSPGNIFIQYRTATAHKGERRGLEKNESLLPVTLHSYYEPLGFSIFSFT